MGPVSASGMKRKTVWPIFLCGGSQGSADCRDIWCRTRTADHALPFPGCLCCAPLSLSCPLLATSLFPGLSTCAVSVPQPLWEKMATTEVETGGWKEALGLSDALNHLCADLFCPGNRDRRCLQVPVVLAFKGQSFRESVEGWTLGRRAAGHGARSHA